MPHGLFDIPASVIAEDRAKYYAKLDSERGEGLYGDIYRKELEYTLDDNSELLDWAANNIDWKDVEQHASPVIEQIKPPTREEIYQAWTNAKKKVISK